MIQYIISHKIGTLKSVQDSTFEYHVLSSFLCITELFQNPVPPTFIYKCQFTRCATIVCFISFFDMFETCYFVTATEVGPLIKQQERGTHLLMSQRHLSNSHCMSFVRVFARCFSLLTASAFKGRF